MEQAGRNQLMNVSNPYQGTDKKVLCVCSAGLLRSPTTAAVLRETKGYNTRAAGLDASHALIPVTHALLVWSDEIVVMDNQQSWVLQKYLDKFEVERRVTVLNVSDNYNYMQEALVDIIKEKVEEYGV